MQFKKLKFTYNGESFDNTGFQVKIPSLTLFEDNEMILDMFFKQASIEYEAIHPDYRKLVRFKGGH